MPYPFDTEFIQQNALVLYGFLGVFALIIGSLLNLIIYRLPLMLKRDMILECRSLLQVEVKENAAHAASDFSGNLPENLKKPFNLFFPRSLCPTCNHTIRAIHNIPLISYIFQGGRCRYCTCFIPMSYPLVEAASALLCLLAAWHFGFTPTLLFAMLFIWVLIILIGIDVKHQILPDVLTLSLLWLGLFANSQSLFTNLSDAVFSAATAYLVLWTFIQIYYLLTGKVGMGHGDFKLFAALSAWFGFKAFPFILIFASLSGGIVGILYLKLKKMPKDTPIPFGPFLSIAGIIYLFFESKIIALY